GWGGTVRLPRIIGNDNAIEWICATKEKKAEAALKEGALDAVVAPDKLDAAAIDLIKEANAGKLNWQAKRQEKLEPLKLNMIESMMSFETAKGFVAGQAGPHYPAPIEAIKSMQKGASEGREKAQKAEAKSFARMARTPVASSLVGLFLNDQLLKKKSSAYEKDAQPVNKAAVLGAGIMGGGIAYQSAYKGTPIMMKDINEPALQLGLDEAKKLLAKRVERKRMTAEQMADALNAIRPTLSYGDFGDVDLVVEAVVENPKIKGAVLAEL
ncbi:3-hydroxyacyl-CoA dehydrogenase NAD-binding domain-containing protein, partial [Oceanospirillum sp. HFRX-1_2]